MTAVDPESVEAVRLWLRLRACSRGEGVAGGDFTATKPFGNGTLSFFLMVEKKCKRSSRRLMRPRSFESREEVGTRHQRFDS